MQNGAAVEAPDPQGKTPLHYAVIFGRAGVVTLLLRRGANKCAPRLAVVHWRVHWSLLALPESMMYCACASVMPGLLGMDGVGAGVRQVGGGRGEGYESEVCMMDGHVRTYAHLWAARSGPGLVLVGAGRVVPPSCQCLSDSSRWCKACAAWLQGRQGCVRAHPHELGSAIKRSSRCALSTRF